jgi:uncharacterized cofD-like protein
VTVPQVVVLGGGHGAAAVLEALRDAPVELTAVVTTADDGGSSGELCRRFGGPAVGDLRRSLIALSGHTNVLATAMCARLSTRSGRHPVGNLLLRTLTDSFGDLETSSRWLGQWLGIAGRVIPASLEPVRLRADTDDGQIIGESAIGATPAVIRRLRFDPDSPHTPVSALRAILTADWVVLAPGSLFTSTLATSALPQVRSAVARTSARVLWVCNLERQRHETAGMTAEAHLAALHRHRVRLDYVLYDPAAALRFTPATLASHGIVGVSAPLQAHHRPVHDAQLLSAALWSLLAMPGDASEQMAQSG